MVKSLHNIIRVRYLLILFLIVTVVYYIVHPDKIYDNTDHFIVNKTTIHYADQFALLPDNPYADFAFLTDNTDKSNIYYYNTKKGLIRQGEIQQLSLGTQHSVNRGNQTTKLDNNEIYMLAYRNNDEIILMQIYADNSLATKEYLVYKNPMFNEIKKDSIVVHNITFSDFEVYKSQSDTLSLIPQSDGYLLRISNNFLNSMVGYADINKPQFQKAATILTTKLKKQFSRSDVFKILSFFNRKFYFHKSLFSKPDLKNKAFTPAHIIGTLDVNKDGSDDFVILIHGTRFINDVIICFDRKNNQTLWKTEIAITTHKWQIIDIDNDGHEEILLGMYSPCNELPIDFYEKEHIGKDGYARFYIMDHLGKIKPINNQLGIQFQQSFSSFRFLFVPETKSIILGMQVKSYKKDHNLLRYDIEKDIIDTLGYQYQSIAGIFREGENIAVINYHDLTLTKNVFDQNMNPISSQAVKVNENFLGNTSKNVTIDGSQYLIMDRFNIFDKNMDLVYNIENKVFDKFIWVDNSCYMIEQQGDDHYCVRYQFHRNRKLSPYLIIIILSQLLIISIYFFFYEHINIPINSPNKSYIASFKIFGKLYYWRIYGKMKNQFEIPKKFSISANEIENLLDEIGANFEKNYERDLIFIKYALYEIKTHNELDIIRRIAHDLKNQTLMMKIAVDKLNSPDCVDKSLVKNIENYCTNISNTSLNLSNFSHIDKLYKETHELNTFIKNHLFRYINHPYFGNISVKYSNHKTLLEFDKKLFEIALRNIIGNALDAINEQGEICIEISDQYDSIILLISNTFLGSCKEIESFEETGYSTKESGSGIGIPITKLIIERHNGIFNLKCNHSIFTVEIQLFKKRRK